MNYQQRNKEELIGELAKLHQRIDELESALNEKKAKSEVIIYNEECLQALMKYNPCLVFLKDEAGRYIYLNETYEKRFVGSKDWYGKTDFDFWSRESAELFRSNDEHILKSGQLYHRIEDSTGLDGNRYCWLCYKFPFIDSKNRKYLAGIGIDATLWVLAEEKARMENAITLGINHILHDALSCRNEEEWSRSCLNVALELTGSNIGFIGEVNQQGYLDDIIVSEMNWESFLIPERSYRKLPNNLMVRGISRRVLQDGIAFFTNDPGSHPDSIGLPAGHPPLYSFIGVPLLEKGQVIGWLAQ